MSERIEKILAELQLAVREEVGAVLRAGLDNLGSLGDEILKARKEANLSLQDVADRSGFTKSHVWELEKGRARNPTVGMLSGLSTALGVPFLVLCQAAIQDLNERAMRKDPTP